MLQAIMIDVLHVGREVATRSSEKSQSLVVWIMRVQQLPVDVVVSQKAELIKLFEDSLSKRHQNSQFAKILVVDSLSVSFGIKTRGGLRLTNKPYRLLFD
jgi:hypothetical protein